MQKIIAIAAVSAVTATNQPKTIEASDVNIVVQYTALSVDMAASDDADEVHADNRLAVGVVPDETTHVRIELPREMITEIQKFIPLKHRSTLYRLATENLPRINGEGIGAYAGVSEHASLQYIRIVKAVKEMKGFQTLEETLEYIWTQEGILGPIRDSPVLSSLPLHQIQGGMIDPNQAATLLDILRGHLELLAGSPIRSDAAFAALVAAHPRGDFRVLFLSRTQITDAGLAHLANLTNLRGLTLSNTQITDAGLVHLSNLTNLQVLYLSDTQITPGAKATLRALIPGLRIYG